MVYSDREFKNDKYLMTSTNRGYWHGMHGTGETWLNSGIQRASSEAMMTKKSMDEVMEEFRMNGVDSPYDPDEEIAYKSKIGIMSGLGPSSAYLRQKSWPAPERTPIQRLKPVQWKPAQDANPTSSDYNFSKNQQSLGNDEYPIQPFSLLTEEQSRVLNTFPDSVLYTILRYMEQGRQVNKNKDNVWLETGRNGTSQGCRFCRNNGERESFVMTHCLKDSYGRVSCPVLRAFICTRCGATGDNAHTIKYCPFSSTEERSKSKAIMRSIRMASGRRRSQQTVPSVNNSENYLLFGEPTPSVVQDSNIFSSMPLDPMWAALEQKLLYDNSMIN